MQKRSIKRNKFYNYLNIFLNCTFLLIFSLFVSLISSCGSQNDIEKRSEAVDTAKIYLTYKKCDNALTALSEAPTDTSDSKYIQTLASAYACKSNYSTINFYGTNLPKISTSLSLFFGSLTTFSTSYMTDPDDSNYSYLLNAINTLLYAGGISQPSTSERLTKFTTKESNDINIQALFMIITALGKYFFYYGNANPTTGQKGSGSSDNGNPNNFSNGCFYDYNPSNAVLKAAMTLARSLNTLGTCTSTATGSPKLPTLPNALTTKRMCQAIILFNNLIDIVVNTSMPLEGGALLDLKSLFSTICSSGTYSSYIGDLCTLKSQSSCETNYASSPESDKLEAYFFAVFELNFTS